MSELKKATLQEIKSDESAATIGDPIPVQFNPSSLRLQITNSTTGGNTRGQQARQFTGSSSTTLTLDLVFDTADEGTTTEPRSDRKSTRLNSSHLVISYAVFCLKKKKKTQRPSCIRPR